MYEQIEKPKENRNRSVVNTVTRKKDNGKQGFGFVDNRPGVANQTALQKNAESGFKNKVFESVTPSSNNAIIQRKIGFEFEIGSVATIKNPTHGKRVEDWIPHSKGEILSNQTNYDVTADISSNGSQLEFVTKPLDETSEGDLEKLTVIAQSIPLDLGDIATVASKNKNFARISQVKRLSGDAWNAFYLAGRSMAGQLQMTGGVKIDSLPSVMSGKAMPKSVAGRSGEKYQDFAYKYQEKVPGSEDLQQPIYQTALVEAKKFKHLDGRSIVDEAAEIMASIMALMSQIPLNARGLIPDGQGQFLARTDYAKILQLLCQHSEILIDPPSFTRAMLNVLNHFAIDEVLTGNDSVYPATYKVKGIKFTEVKIHEWVEGVLPSLGFLWGYWQGKDLITKKHFPGTQEQKNELRPFGEFGSKTDPGNKIILEWRNLQMMDPSELVIAMVGLADYLKKSNDT